VAGGFPACWQSWKRKKGTLYFNCVASVVIVMECHAQPEHRKAVLFSTFLIAVTVAMMFFTSRMTSSLSSN